MIAPTTAGDEVPAPGPGAHGAGALILGGAHGSLAIARSLGRRGIPVWFITDDHPLPGFSRYVRKSFGWSGPAHLRAFDQIVALAHRHGLTGFVLIPGGDPEVRFVAQNHAALAALFRVPMSAWETVRFAHDKRLTYQRAAALGIPTPRIYDTESAQQLAAMEVRFPVILKPTTHGPSNPFTVAKAWRADDRKTLLARYQQAAALVGEQAILVQELILGTGAAQFSYAALCRDGEPVAGLVARRARQYPVDFGFTSTYVESVDVPEVETAARRFLTSLRYTGLVEIEFKFDARERRYKILDVNPRTWAWIGLGAAAGVDFGDLLWRFAMGAPLPEARGRPGVAWVHVVRDLVAACQEMRAGTLTPGDYARSLRRCRVLASFAADDPVPGLIELPLVLTRVISRRLRSKARPNAEADHAARTA